jgi:hypothetical protein
LLAVVVEVHTQEQLILVQLVVLVVLEVGVLAGLVLMETVQQEHLALVAVVVPVHVVQEP